MLVMTYNYRWSGSTITGAIAPLDNTSRTVKIHIARYLKYAAASKIIMGVPYYGYDWPVTSDVPNATVNKPVSKYGGVWSVTYSSSRKYLAAHPEVLRQEDTPRAARSSPTGTTSSRRIRQVYFEDELSAAAKYDYAIASGLAGVGHLDPRQRPRLHRDVRRHPGEVLRSEPSRHGRRDGHQGQPVGRLRSGSPTRSGSRTPATCPSGARSIWRIYDRAGHLSRRARSALTIYPGRTRTIKTTTILGTAAGLRAGTYKLKVQFVSKGGIWKTARRRLPPAVLRPGCGSRPGSRNTGRAGGVSALSPDGCMPGGVHQGNGVGRPDGRPDDPVVGLVSGWTTRGAPSRCGGAPASSGRHGPTSARSRQSAPDPARRPHPSWSLASEPARDPGRLSVVDPLEMPGPVEPVEVDERQPA